MKKLVQKISYIGISVICSLFISCEDYLDKSPESSIGDENIFGTFFTFQGFVEEMYSCIVDYNKAGSWNRYLYADETLHNNPYAEDQGNYWDQGYLFYNESIGVNTTNEARNKRIWHNAWYAIRKANLALEKIDLLQGTEQERKLIEGQAYFLRGWFHFELARWWGGLPYIDKVLDPSANLQIPRLTFQETVKRAAEDFAKAANLLPVDWNEWASNADFRTNENHNRISKVFALAYQGKALLYAGSPMPNEEADKGSIFDVELCKQAADALGQALKVCDETQAYKLQPWATWTDNFWVWSQGNRQQPGGTEVIMGPTRFDNRVRWSTVGATCPTQFGLNANTVEVPTLNIVKMYAMKNGLPIDDPDSGYNPDDPWSNREPRFYSDIIVDGDKMVESSNAKDDQYAQLYTGGRHRIGGTVGNGSVSGFYYKRYSPIGCNQWDGKVDNFQAFIPYMRLADVHLMYAEATLQGYGLNATATGYTITSVQALETIRSRAQLDPLPERYINTTDALMQSIIRERAIELAYEAARHHDLRRWNISGSYKEKYVLDFDRGTNGKPVNMRERVHITRVFEKKHNWWPFQTKFTKLYPGFQQNPGW